SGGPAITESGQVFGLLTYRYQDPAAENAAKSYIRDIKGFQDLAGSKNVNLSGDNKTQVAWAKGLELFSESHLSAAVKQFDEVKSLYPAHTMVSSYIDRAQEGIKQGKDVKGIPLALILVGIGVTVIGTGTAVVFIVLHRKRHGIFKANQPTIGGPAPVSPLPATALDANGAMSAPVNATGQPEIVATGLNPDNIIAPVQTTSNPQPISQILPAPNSNDQDVLPQPPAPPQQNGQ
ncbi:MAG: hypothetical protein ABI354_00835, partial [Candidatus Saccharimonadales bacterium]